MLEINRQLATKKDIYDVILIMIWLEKSGCKYKERNKRIIERFRIESGENVDYEIELNYLYYYQ